MVSPTAYAALCRGRERRVGLLDSTDPLVGIQQQSLALHDRLDNQYT